MKTPNYLLVILLAAGTSFSANAASLAIDWFTMDGGGGTSTNNTLGVSGTLGQLDAGNLSGGTLGIEGGYWGVITAVDAPRLTITRTDTNTVVVSWSSSLTGFALEQNEDLGTTHWMASSESLNVSEDGKTKFIVVTPPVGNRFYRLRRSIPFDNFDLDGGFHPQNHNGGAFLQLELGRSHAGRSAAQFRVTGGNFRLTSITLPIAVVKTGAAEDALRVRLTEDANDTPGPTLEVLSLNQDIWPAFSDPFTVATTLRSAATPLLLQGRRYWIVTELGPFSPSGPLYVAYFWFGNSRGATAPSRSQTRLDSSVPSDPEPWTDTFLSTENVAFRVTGELVGP